MYLSFKFKSRSGLTISFLTVQVIITKKILWIVRNFPPFPSNLVN